MEGPPAHRAAGTVVGADLAIFPGIGPLVISAALERMTVSKVLASRCSSHAGDATWLSPAIPSSSQILHDHEIRVSILGMRREIALLRCIPALANATTRASALNSGGPFPRIAGSKPTNSAAYLRTAVGIACALAEVVAAFRPCEAVAARRRNTAAPVWRRRTSKERAPSRR
jgi:hypothetical protein